MLILSADTSSKNLSFMLADIKNNDVNVVDSVVYEANGKINELFFSSLDLFLKCENIKGKDIDEWVVITGPGSFTGIRIGIASLSGVCAGFNKKLLGLNAFDAAAVLTCLERVTVGIQLKLNEFAYKTYDFDKKKYSEVLITDYSELPKECVIVNSGAKNRNTENLPPLSFAIGNPLAKFFFQEPKPVYVRKSEAELNFDKRSTN